MKKIASFLLIVIALTSCEEEITRNNPSVQGLKDNVLWRANDYSVVLQGNGFVISALTRYETLTLKTNGRAKGVYVLGFNNTRTATFVDDTNGQKLTFATGQAKGDGEIVITEYDEINQTISGTFRFNALNVDNNPAGGEILNFQEGVFYKVPIDAPVIPQ